jgi:hypothetical protein
MAEKKTNPHRAIIFSSPPFAEGLAVFENSIATLTSGFRTVFVVLSQSKP